MDTETEKTPLEESPSLEPNNDDNNDNKEDNNDGGDGPKQSDSDQDKSQNSQSTSPSKQDEEETEEDKQDEEDPKTESKEDDAATELKIEIPPPPPIDVALEEIEQYISKSGFSSPLPPIFHKVSEEIKQFVASSANSTDDGPKPNVSASAVKQFAVLVEAKIEYYSSSDNPVKWNQLTDSDRALFLDTVYRVSMLSKALSEIDSEEKDAVSINLIGRVLQLAMSYMEEEFRSLLEEHKASDVDAPSNTNQDAEQNAGEEPTPAEENNFPGYSDETVSNLKRLSMAMIVGDHEAECCHVYFVARRNALEESINKLGYEKYSLDDVQKMQWESLEREIASWIKAFKQCTSVYFPDERKISDAIFSDHPSISEHLCYNISRRVVFDLLNFSEAVSMTKRAAEKLFKFLDMYETLRDSLPTMDSLYPAECLNEFKTDATLIRNRLGEAMVCIFTELENSIKADSGKTPVPGGAVHPLTRYTMNYLKYACEYKDTIEQVFKEYQKIDRADSARGSEFDYNSNAQGQQQRETTQESPFQVQIRKVMDLLDANLENKSKLYKDVSLSVIFMMNNGRYILQKIRGSTEINTLMGDAWCRKRSSDLRQYHKSYQRETWGKLLSCLNPEGLLVNGKVVKPVLKERFKSFNAMFDEIHKTQSTWVVSDEQLQSELRVSISNMVIPAYRSFLGRFSGTFTPGRQTEKYVKYQPEDIETYIDELFDGNAASMGKKKA